MELYIHSPIHFHGVVLNSLSTGTTLPYLTLPNGFTFIVPLSEERAGEAWEPSDKIMPFSPSLPSNKL
jgi:putative alpha-1,2-mannosidase